MLSSGSKGEVTLLPSPPASHLRTSWGFPVPIRALPLPCSLRIPVGEGALKHSELWGIPPWGERVLTSQKAATTLTLGLTPLASVTLGFGGVFLCIHACTSN